MLANENPDAVIVKHPESWPLRPLLPLRRPDAGEPLGYELGVLVAPRVDDDNLVVVRAELSELCEAKRQDRLEALPAKVYRDASALLADGWEVD